MEASDLSDPESVERLVRSTLEEAGSIDILVHAAGGLTQFGPPEEQSLAGVESEWRSNFVTAFLLAAKSAVAALTGVAAPCWIWWTRRPGWRRVSSSRCTDAGRAR